MPCNNRIKIGGLAMGAILSFTLAACSPPINPLKEADSTEAARFLVHASQSAEKHLHIFKSGGGEYYGRCMLGKENPVLCVRLYNDMATYAKTTPDFNKVTVRDLTDRSMFKGLKEDYQRERFNSLPEGED